MKQTTNIAILLATYNGARYLSEQMDSLIAQTYSNWQLFIHDDGSQDDTTSILERYEAMDTRIHVLHYPIQGDACRNFMSLMNAVQAPYYMFCDQDDVWLPDKIEREMELMQQCEQKYPNKPVIVHSDLQVVDSGLRTISPSFWEYENIQIERYQRWEDFSHGCLTTGCTMLFNDKIKALTLPVTNSTLMHDEWVTLCAIAQDGIIAPLRCATMLYRQHSDNTLGAQSSALRHSLTYLCSHIGQIIRANIDHYKQMKAIRSISVFAYLKHKLL